jgi:hypothetical protein
VTELSDPFGTVRTTPQEMADRALENFGLRFEWALDDRRAR